MNIIVKILSFLFVFIFLTAPLILPILALIFHNNIVNIIGVLFSILYIGYVLKQNRIKPLLAYFFIVVLSVLCKSITIIEAIICIPLLDYLYSFIGIIIYKKKK